MRVKSLLVEDEKNELNRRLDVEARKIEMCQDANLRTQFELTAAMRSLEKVNSDLRASSRQNDALNVCLSRNGIWFWKVPLFLGLRY